MKKPVIGITPSHNTDNDDISVRPTYLRAIEAAGGLSILLPLEVSGEDLKQLSKLCDGFLFSGGPDIHPFPSKEETHTQCGNIHGAGYHGAIPPWKLAVDARKPVLGICRGAQIINVGLGGDIYQDISSQTETVFPIAHKQPYSCCLPSRHVDVRRDTLLYTIAEEKQIAVNSSHHQAVRRIAPCLMASGHAPDGIIEALEMPDYPYLLALQWHPGIWADRHCVRQYI
ncbi:MAG: gamma-glutamyl-gamma-aminobutyrate hydrolase family protein [Enterocloster clostridioformis]